MPSFFENSNKTVPSGSMRIEEIYDDIKNPTREICRALTMIRDEDDKKKRNAMKKLLPAVTFSGEFTKRDSETGLDRHTGFYVYDLDGVSPLTVKRLVSDLPHLVMAFTSPGGNGLKIVLRGPVAEDELSHKHLWNIGAAIVEEATHAEVDRSGSDVTRLCFLSADKRIIRGASKTFSAVVSAEKSVADDKESDDIMRGVPAPATDFSYYNGSIVREMLWKVGSDVPYDKWRNIIWAVVSHLGKKQWVLDMLWEWSVELGGDRACTDEKLFENISSNPGKGITFATMIQMAKKAGWIDWRRMLRRDEEDKVLKDEENLRIILTNHPDFAGRLYYDEISKTESMEPRKSVVTCTTSTGGGMVEDGLAFSVLCDLQGRALVPFRGAKMVLQAMSSVAQLNPRNVRREWLNDLKWDGKKRLRRLFIDGFGAADNDVNAALGVCFLGGAAARIIKPGVSVQVVPILQGPQGCGKSSGIKALCPLSGMFCDSFLDMESKSGYEVLLSANIVELSELSSMNRGSIERVKQILTQQTVRFRTPYKRNAESHDASWVFIGTTNADEYLKDTTGNRRFAPIKIESADPKKVVDWINTNRDQMWAEAATLANKGIKSGTDTWEMPRELWDAVAREAESVRECDPWEDMVRDYSSQILASGKTAKKSMRDIAIESGVPVKSRIDELHLGRVLRKVGWERKLMRVGTTVARRWLLERI